jgi:sterol desaturase/sphingolipid hydroxylase (fatty acid hydroxylase superfamily)
MMDNAMLLVEFFGLLALAQFAVVFVPLERILPRHRRALLRKDWKLDLTYWFFNRPLVVFGGLLMAAAAMVVIAPLVPAAVTSTIEGLPLLVQIPLAILVADLIFYWVHRAAHTFPLLWQFHAVHHSIEDLDFLAAVRVHPVDQLLTTSLGIVAQLLLGFSPAALAVTAFIYGWQAIFVHSNVAANLGPLRWVFAGPDFHHWHHSTDAEAQNRNFAGQLPFLDRFFGSAYFPSDRLPSTYGVSDPVPDSFADQLLYPLKRCFAMRNRNAGSTA